MRYNIAMKPPSDRGFGPITLPSGGVATLRRCDDYFYLKAAAQSMPIELSCLNCEPLA